MRVAVAVELSDAERKTLEQYARSPHTCAPGCAREDVLLAEKGQQNITIAAELGVQEKTVALWRKRFWSSACRASRRMRLAEGDHAVHRVWRAKPRSSVSRRRRRLQKARTVVRAAVPI